MVPVLTAAKSAAEGAAPASAARRPVPGGVSALSDGRGLAHRGVPAAAGAVALRIDARDPISEAGVRMQLRPRPEIRLVGPGEPAAVAVAVVDAVDEECTR